MMFIINTTNGSPNPQLNVIDRKSEIPKRFIYRGLLKPVTINY